MSVAQVLLALCLAALSSHHGVVAQEQFEQTSTFLSSLAELKLFSGVVDIRLQGELVYSQGYGSPYMELNVSMPTNAVFLLGSNTKLITAIAVYQLAEQGLVDVSAPVSKYLDPKDFNLTTEWCPHVQGTTEGPCQTPTLEQILSMGSGIQAIDNCPYKPQDFQWPSCLKNKPGGYSMGLEELRLAAGGYTTKDLIVASNILELPLSFAPGSAYEYSNPGFWLPTYIIEKVSNLTYEQYLQKNLFDAAGLNRFAYGASVETENVISGLVPWPGYFSGFDPISQVEAKPLGVPELPEAALEELGYQNSSGSLSPSANTTLPQAGGTYNATDSDASGYARFVGLARPVFLPQFFSLANGAGAVVGDAEGLATLYLTMVSNPRALKLSRNTILRMLNSVNQHYTASTPFGPLRYAQGTTVVLGGEGSLPRYLYYQGDLASFAARILMRVNAIDPSQSDVITQLTNLYPIVPPPQQPDQCPPLLELNDIMNVNDVLAGTPSNGTIVLPDEFLCGLASLSKGIFYAYLEALLRKAWLGVN